VRIYELGLLPPFVFPGRIASVDHRWNQRGLTATTTAGFAPGSTPAPSACCTGAARALGPADAGQTCLVEEVMETGGKLSCRRIAN